MGNILGTALGTEEVLSPQVEFAIVILMLKTRVLELLVVRPPGHPHSASQVQGLVPSVLGLWGWAPFSLVLMG